ncbi:MAG TPA: DUF309 domain-containing protein [Candidatus Polarisedimenticolia bacterium]|nr:DUF309 domain-containing protein [Candidatus Polarisedimenticolia bacterium]
MDAGRIRLLREGIELFDRRQFFEAHEVWEDAWRRAAGGDALLLHGLIQAAAGFHKLQVGQPGGAASLLTKAAAKLEALAPDAPVAGLPEFRASLESWIQTASRMTERGTIEYDEASIPLLPEPRRGPFERRIHSHVTIEAPAGRVWEVLTEFPAYPRWNEFIVRLEGIARPGERLKVEIRPPGRRGMSFRPIILVADKGRELRWLGRVILPGVFDGEHVFTIAPLGSGHVRFSQRETFRGLLIPLMPRSMWETTRRGFEEMNAALKRQAEAP